MKRSLIIIWIILSVLVGACANGSEAYRFYMACLKGDLSAVEKLLPQVDVNGLLSAEEGARFAEEYIKQFETQFDKPEAEAEFIKNLRRLPLHLAAETGNTEIADLLLKAGADLDAVTGSGYTALMFAAEKGFPEIADLLIKAGADINITQNGGYTALMIAASYGFPEIADLLIKAGADPKKVANNGSTAATLAMGQENGELVLQAMGLEVESEDKFGVVQNDDGSLTIYYRGSSKDIIIPSKLYGLPVTKIGNEAFRNDQLTSVVIPNSVTTIGIQAFYDNQLTSVVIPNSVTTIEAVAFGNNPLTSLKLGNRVSTIGWQSFDPWDLTSITIAKDTSDINTKVFERGFVNYYDSQNRAPGTYVKNGPLWSKK
jgi:hypothetical protein